MPRRRLRDDRCLRAIAHGYVRTTTDIDPTDPDKLANGASSTLETHAVPVDYLHDVPGAAGYSSLRSRPVETTAASVTVRSSHSPTSSG